MSLVSLVTAPEVPAPLLSLGFFKQGSSSLLHCVWLSALHVNHFIVHYTYYNSYQDTVNLLILH